MGATPLARLMLVLLASFAIHINLATALRFLARDTGNQNIVQVPLRNFHNQMYTTHVQMVRHYNARQQKDRVSISTALRKLTPVDSLAGRTPRVVQLFARAHSSVHGCRWRWVPELLERSNATSVSVIKGLSRGSLRAQPANQRVHADRIPVPCLALRCSYGILHRPSGIIQPIQAPM